MYSWAYQYYRGKLNDKQQRIYDCIYRGWFTYKRDIQFSPSLLDVDTVSEIVQAVNCTGSNKRSSGNFLGKLLSLHD